MPAPTGPKTKKRVGLWRRIKWRFFTVAVSWPGMPSRKTCPDCKSAGYLRNTPETPTQRVPLRGHKAGFPCDTCKGRGTVVDTNYPSFAGTGRPRKR